MFRPVRIILTALLLSVPLGTFAAALSFAADGGRKIVVELFTSQGCSSCPPADAHLAELAKRDDVIALSFHVDYWNYIGWTDPYSSPEATARQRAYGRALGRRYVYTPQIVVDGRAEAVGSNRNAVENLIRMAAAAQKVPIDVTHGKDGAAHISVPAASGPARGELWIGFYDDGGATDVAAGENAGATIVNANVVRAFRRIGVWDGSALTHRVDLKALGASGRDGCVVVLQAADNGPVLGAASFPLTPGT